MPRCILVMTIAALVSAVACMRTPEWPPEAGVLWKRHIDSDVGYLMDYPAGCEVETHDHGVIIRYQGAPIISLSHLTEEEARARGLWPGHEPVGEIEMGGRKGRVYSYDHFDGPFGRHTMAYVVPHRGKWFGLELRMKGDTPGPLQTRVVESVMFASHDDGDS